MSDQLTVEGHHPDVQISDVEMDPESRISASQPGRSSLQQATWWPDLGLELGDGLARRLLRPVLLQAALVTGRTSAATITREWSPMKSRISTSVPSARAQWVTSARQHSLGNSASKPMKELLGCFLGSGTMKPRRSSTLNRPIARLLVGAGLAMTKSSTYQLGGPKPVSYRHEEVASKP